MYELSKYLSMRKKVHLFVCSGQPLRVCIDADHHLHLVSCERISGRKFLSDSLQQQSSGPLAAVEAVFDELISKLDQSTSVACAIMQAQGNLTGIESPSINTKAKECRACLS
jgi:hypothetical protein